MSLGSLAFRSARSRVQVFLTAALAAAAPALAQPAAHGPEFQVNSYTTDF